MTTVAIPIAGLEDDCSGNALAGPSLFRQDFERFGGFFFSFPSASLWRFANPIPTGSSIQSAALRMVASHSDGGALTQYVNRLRRSPIQHWSQTSEGPVWEVGSSQALRVVLSDNLGSPRYESATAAAATVADPIRDLETVPGAPLRERLAQLVPAPASAYSLFLATVKLRRVGSPPGSVRIVVRESVVDVVHGTQVPGPVIGQSTSRTLASIATGAADQTFVFSPLLPIAAGTDFFVSVEPDAYATSSTDFLEAYYQASFGGPVGLRTYGTGRGFDSHAYHSASQVWALADAADVAEDVAWAVPAMIAGQEYSSPDLSALIQPQVDAGHRWIGLGVRGKAPYPSTFRRVAAYGHASYAPAILDVEYTAARGPVSARVQGLPRVAGSLQGFPRVEGRATVSARATVAARAKDRAKVRAETVERVTTLARLHPEAT